MSTPVEVLCKVRNQCFVPPPPLRLMAQKSKTHPNVSTLNNEKIEIAGHLKYLGQWIKKSNDNQN